MLTESQLIETESQLIEAKSQLIEAESQLIETESQLMLLHLPGAEPTSLPLLDVS